MFNVLVKQEFRVSLCKINILVSYGLTIGESHFYARIKLVLVKLVSQWFKLFHILIVRTERAMDH